MKTRIFTATVLVFGFIFAAATFVDLSGKWNGALTVQGNNIPLTYVFKQDGENLTGSVTSPQGEIPITEGKTNGSEFVFVINVNGSVVKNTGKYYADGDTVAINVDFGTTKMHSRLLRAQQ